MPSELHLSREDMRALGYRVVEMIVGIVLTATLVAAPVGIPVIILGFLLMLIRFVSFVHSCHSCPRRR